MDALNDGQPLTDARRAIQNWRDYLAAVKAGDELTLTSAAVADLRVTLTRALKGR